MILVRHELKQNFKNFIIWLLCVGGMCFGCVLMYGSVEESLDQMGELFANMGTMSTALGMDRISLNTLTGYYATEIAMLHGLGGAMFAAILGCNLLSKEEQGHTIEYLGVLPISREKIVLQKYVAMVIYIVIFQVICTISYMGSFMVMSEEVPTEKMCELAGCQTLLMLEVATICYMLSAWSKRNMMGVGLGVALLFFAMDMMCRIVPAIENLKYVTPFYYCNATDIFTDTEVSTALIGIGVGVTIVAYILANQKYVKKDLQ